MAMNLTNEGRLAFLRHILGIEPLGKLVVHLYRNEINASDRELTLKSLEENNEDGYQPVVLDPAKWKEYKDDRGMLFAVCEDVAFNFSTSVPKCYGCFVTNETNDKLLWVEPFEAGKSWSIFSHKGGTYWIDTRLLLG